MPRASSLFPRVLALLVTLLLLFFLGATSRQIFGYALFDGAQESGTAKGVAEDTLSAKFFPPQAVQRIIPAGSRLAPVDSIVVRVVSAEGTARGVLVSTVSQSDRQQGFAGSTPLLLYFSPDDTLRAAEALPNDETADFFAAARGAVLTPCVGKPLATLLGAEVDGASGATYSSRSLQYNLRAGLRAYARWRQAQQGDGALTGDETATAFPAIGWVKALLVIAVVALALGGATWWRRSKWVHLLSQVLNVAVLGFWCGQYLSLSLLRGWVSTGAVSLAAFPLLLLAVLAIALPLFGVRGFYCARLCPFGAAQALVAKLPAAHCRYRLTMHQLTMLRRLQKGIFFALLLSLWLPIGAEILAYEPFSVFTPQAVSLAQIAFSLSLLLLSYFVPRLWCKALCPLGFLLSQLDRFR